MRKPVSWMDPQQRHNQAFIAPKPDKVADAKTLEASLKMKTAPKKLPRATKIFDPIASAMCRHPGLTSVDAANMAEDFGF